MTSPISSLSHPSTNRFTVLVVDDHPMVAEVIGSRPVVGSSIGFVTTGTDAIERCRRMRPDVVVLDLGLPDVDGFEVVQRVRDGAESSPKFLVVSGYESPEILLRSMRLGVDGFREKSVRVEEIAAAVELVAGGGQAFTASQQAQVRPLMARLTVRSREAASLAATLTPRERQLLHLVVRGHTNRQCARRLGVAERTVESHLFKVYAKLGASTRIAAVQRALSLNLVDLTAAPSVLVSVGP